jgi:nicotinate phosphoribosyltransferase
MLRVTDKPVITSMLDLDFYKINIAHMAYRLHRNIPVEFRLLNRTKKVRLAEHINVDRLKEELDHVRTLRATVSEMSYLRGINVYADRMFDEDFLSFYQKLKLPEYELYVEDGQFILSFYGMWPEVTFWETIALSIIDELYYESLMMELSTFERQRVYSAGTLRLGEKMDMLKKYPFITFSDFGTRRRFSKEWQSYVVEALQSEMPASQFLGTSNTYLAFKCGLTPMGTYPHEGPMVYSGIYHNSPQDIKDSHHQFLSDWWDTYGVALSVALTDTYGTDFFFRDMTPKQAREWKGLRHDSNEPKPFGYRAIDYYKGLQVDPTTKLVVFSDGLTAESIVDLAVEFRNKIKTTFGWGTTLTNDLGFGNISLVAKVMKANGHRTVKLSDNIAKATGTPEDVEYFKTLFEYDRTYSKECLV